MYRRLESKFAAVGSKLDVDPMKTGSVQKFQIDKLEKYKNCPLQSDTYNVKKEEMPYDDDPGTFYNIFYAITDESFVLQNNDDCFIMMEDHYKHQIGYALCEPGFIKKVLVNEDPVNARRCGIATTLSILCLIDPELSAMGDKNVGIKYFDDPHIKPVFEKQCKHFVGLTMTAEKNSGGGAYLLSAALKSGYTKVAIKNKNTQEYKILSVKKTKRDYKAETGMIDDLDTFDTQWFFCKIPWMHVEPL